ncbi:MAG: 2,5-dioxovalerate dehydrogenase [uncultured Phycisphaerae bacterium]|uniref:2,5-dioxovalerate dehydrogenase n=1 Tax=uncultured Phycisphaerae bacterium TaxID=904963 RepID=A0A6J4P7N5_9BACT|nr:MAG: 2,5-dioxovalerate dehydrogenase [uncultured Phycisphaerae bacterium]
MQLHGQNIVGNEISCCGGVAFRGANPATGAELDPDFFEADLVEVNRAMEMAEAAFDPYRRAAPAARAAFLDRIGAEIDALGDALIDRAVAETGLAAERLKGERARTVNQLRMFARLVEEGSWVGARVDRAIPDRKPLPKPDLRRLLVPLGPVVAFAASNFPLAISVAGNDTASGLAAGCPVVVKAHPAHPGTSELVASAIVAAVRATGMPDGVFSMLHARGHEVGLALVRHPLTKAVGFTGSLRGGRALMDAAAARPEPIPVYAEMGSINPVFVLPGALGERGRQIAEGLKASVTLGVGQFCTCPGLVVGLEGDATRRFIDDAASLFAGAPRGNMLYAGIRDAYQAGLSKFAGVPGVTLAARSPDAPTGPGFAAGAALFTTDARTYADNPLLADEVFGPSTLVVTGNSRAELIDLALGLAGHLTATIHGTADDLREYADLVAVLERKVGRLVFNGFPTGIEPCPAVHHGGPYPATSDAGRSTSIGTAAIERFTRPLCYQNWPQDALPPELRDENPRNIWRMIDGEMTRSPVGG